MAQHDIAQKLQHIQQEVTQHANGTTEIAEMERLLLSELLTLGEALLQEFIDQKKVDSASRNTAAQRADAAQ